MVTSFLTGGATNKNLRPVQPVWTLRARFVLVVWKNGPRTIGPGVELPSPKSRQLGPINLHSCLKVCQKNGFFLHVYLPTRMRVRLSCLGVMVTRTGAQAATSLKNLGSDFPLPGDADF